METKINSEIKLTEKAAKEIKQLMSENSIGEDYGLRIAVKGGGCNGMTYKLGFEADVKDGDSVIEQNGVKLIIDGRSLFYLTGCELDFSSGLNGRGFIFNNPNAAKTCGCGESFAV